MNEFDRLQLIQAYNHYVLDKVFCGIQESLFNLSDLVGQSQYFELNMEKYYKNFHELKDVTKQYLYKRLRNDIINMHYIIKPNIDIIQINFNKIENKEINPFDIWFKID